MLLIAVRCWQMDVFVAASMCFKHDKWCTAEERYSTFPLGLPRWTCPHVLDEEQTLARPSLSGNNIRFSEKHFLRSDKEIPPLIKYDGGIYIYIYTHMLSLWGMKQIHFKTAPFRKKHSLDFNMNKTFEYSDSLCWISVKTLFLFTALLFQYKQASSRPSRKKNDEWKHTSVFYIHTLFYDQGWSLTLVERENKSICNKILYFLVLKKARGE